MKLDVGIETKSAFFYRLILIDLLMKVNELIMAYFVTADPLFCHGFAPRGEGDLREFLGGDGEGERLLLSTGDGTLFLLLLDGEDDGLRLCLLSSLLSSLLPSPLLPCGDFDRDRIRGFRFMGDLKI